MVDQANTALKYPVNSRAGLKEYCLRKLGKPVIQINLDDQQIEDAIDDAFLVFQDHHEDGTTPLYFKYQIQAADIVNQFIPIPDFIIGVKRIFPPTDGNSTVNMFDIRYQMRLNDLYDFTSSSVVTYWMTMTHIRLLDMLFNGETPVRYNRHINKLYIDWDWKNPIVGPALAGQYIIVDATGVASPETYPDVYNDRWLKKMTTAMMKKQWGSNLKKYTGVQLLGGVQLNGQVIYDEAIKEIADLEIEVENKWQLPPEFLVG